MSHCSPTVASLEMESFSVSVSHWQYLMEYLESYFQGISKSTTLEIWRDSHPPLNEIGLNEIWKQGENWKTFNRVIELNQVSRFPLGDMSPPSPLKSENQSLFPQGNISIKCCYHFLPRRIQTNLKERSMISCLGLHSKLLDNKDTCLIMKMLVWGHHKASLVQGQQQGKTDSFLLYHFPDKKI